MVGNKMVGNRKRGDRDEGDRLVKEQGGMGSWIMRRKGWVFVQNDGQEVFNS